MRDNMKFLWNQDAGELLDGEGTEAKFMNQISYDNEDNKTARAIMSTRAPLGVTTTGSHPIRTSTPRRVLITS